jgi:hypothetical protein
MTKIIAALLFSTALALPSVANAVPEANTGQCVKAANDARKAAGNQANGQNNTTPRSDPIQAIKDSLAEFGTCTPPAPLPCPGCGGGGETPAE